MALFSSFSDGVRDNAAGSSQIPQEIVDRIIGETDIVGIVGEVVELRPRKGGQEYIGRCPFHNDSNPSLSVNPGKGVYSCWVCEAGNGGSRGGDAVTFVRRFFDMNYPQALAYLAERLGVVISDGAYRIERPVPSGRRSTLTAKTAGREHPDTTQINLAAQKDPLYKAMTTAYELFRSKLVSDPQALGYLTTQRKLPLEVLNRFQIGYAPDDLFFIPNAFPALRDSNVLIDCGLVTERTSRRTNRPYRAGFFTDRIVFGVRDDQGRTVAFGARRMDRGKESKLAKYINTPDTAIFTKSEEIFGLYEAREGIARAGCVLVVEGYVDVLALAGVGIDNAVAIMGTAMTPAQAKKLLAASGRVILCLDGDSAGQRAAMRALTSLLPVMTDPSQVAFLRLEAGKDPDKMVTGGQHSEILESMAAPMGLLEFIDSSMLADAQDSDQRARLQRIEGLLAAMPQFPGLVDSLRRRYSKWFPQTQGANTAPTRLRARASAKINSPIERLTLAARDCPQVASEMRGEMLRWAQEHRLDQDATLLAWLKTFDAAIQEGLSRPRELSSFALSRQEDLVRAGVSILSQRFAELSSQALAVETKNKDRNRFAQRT